MNQLRWKIGNVEIFQIVEPLDNAGEVMQSCLQEATPEILRSIDWLYPHFIDEKGKMKALVQSFLLKSNGTYILVDTCNGNGKIRSDFPEWSNLHTSYMENFLATGVKPEEVSLVISTHLHTDHVGWNTRYENGSLVPTFPNASYLFVDKDYEYWKSQPEKEMAADKEAFVDSVLPILDSGLGKIVNADYKIDEHISLLPTPGHTPGHVSIIIESNGQKALISGDFIHHPSQFVYPEWEMTANVLPEVATETRKKVLEELADTETLLLGSHFANPVAGKVVRGEKGFIFKTS
ncbi:MAG TPA: MBL fold metallo-hydrolase [Candidatus Saccharimonadales bacterium]|nr:MBL fold metallo-hydrolase [Candidatus Saccharimonadales bacterium]